MQIAHMLWRSAFYRSVNESRRFLPNDAEGGKQANATLHQFIEDGFFVGNSIAIRRLLDRSPGSGPRGVNSLYGLIRDIKDQVHLLTRANMLAARGLEYDFEPIKDRAFDEARSKSSGGYFVAPNGWFEAEFWHKAMDRLCGVTEDRRSPWDTPDQRRLESLLTELEERGRSVEEWANKFVVHAASQESRQTLNRGEQSMSLSALWLAERVVVRAAGFTLHYFVDGTNVGGIPHPQFDQFIYLDRPFIESCRGVGDAAGLARAFSRNRFL